MESCDAESFTRVVRQHDGRLRGLAFRLLGGDASRLDDVMQDAYIKAFRALPRYRSVGDPGTWLYRITYNACIDELRRSRRRPVPVDVTTQIFDQATGAPTPERHVLAADVVARALAALSPEQRATVVLVDGEGFDNVSAASILGIAPGTVASRLSRARVAMRAALEEVS